MKKILLLLFVITFVSYSLYANGVGIVDASNSTYLNLKSSIVEVEVENQVGIIKATQTFQNTLLYPVNFKYAFPLPAGASAIGLRWYINGAWKEAGIKPEPADTTLPGDGNPDPDLTTYLGDVPLFFDISDTLFVDSLTIFEVTYVQFLPYSFGNVTFSYPNNYQLIQSSPLDSQHFLFSLNSDRTIEDIQVLSHTATQVINNGNYAFAEVLLSEHAADSEYKILYKLSSDELGLFSFTTSQPDTLVPDSLGNGFFTFVAEPDPGETTDVIKKVFTLIVDRSGSMSGDKIIQARNAASFIVQNLNEGDKFNIVDFSTNVTSFRQEHVDFNSDNESAALAYVSTFEANGSTNISGAFDAAVPQFSVANDSTANIIIFLTDGMQTAGITDSELLLEHINNLVKTTETNLVIFCFGIGLDVNQQLLTLIAQNNLGIATYLMNDELEEVITNFYLQIRNPVLLNTTISFSPQIITEVFPDPLPNLYKGQQMIVTGRYNESANVTVTLNGEAFENAVEYSYNMPLSDTSVYKYQFLPKVWAKLKIEHLLVEYYSLYSGSEEAEAIKEEIKQISLAYGVVSPFTSFGDVGNGRDISEVDKGSRSLNYPKEYKLLGNYPNPFNPSTTIRFSVGDRLDKVVKVKIYNSIGEIVRVLTVFVGDSGIYEVVWDGLLYGGISAPSDVYIYVIDFENIILAGKMILMK